MKFILLIKTNSGEQTFLTHQCDLVQAIAEFLEHWKSKYGDDKGSGMPHLIGAKLLPLNGEGNED